MRGLLVFTWVCIFFSAISTWDLKSTAEKYWTQVSNQRRSSNNEKGLAFYEKPSVERITAFQPRSPQGCNYRGRLYKNKEQVETTQPCLSCSCQRGLVSCFLRVCPTLPPARDSHSHCVTVREPGRCCAFSRCESNEVRKDDGRRETRPPTSTSIPTSTTTRMTPKKETPQRPIVRTKDQPNTSEKKVPNYFRIWSVLF